jgi:hypothetical protein
LCSSIARLDSAQVSASRTMTAESAPTVTIYLEDPSWSTSQWPVPWLHRGSIEDIGFSSTTATLHKIFKLILK